MEKLVQGTYAAALNPRKQSGELDEATCRGLLDFLMERGIQGFTINGATGELCRTTEAEFDRLMAIAAEQTKGKAKFLAGLGAATADGARKLGEIAYRRGADAVLLPMPYFYPYSQSDLVAFCRAVAGSLELPVLLYNLPQFTTPLEPSTSFALIRECESIIGIKDSSGSLATLQLLTREGVDACRIVGSDQALCAALREGVLDGVVSGPACVFPELIQDLYRTAGETDTSRFEKLENRLDGLLQQLTKFPVPWGLKILAEARGLAKAVFPLPLSPERQKEKAELETWFRGHSEELGVEFARL